MDNISKDEYLLHSIIGRFWDNFKSRFFNIGQVYLYNPNTNGRVSYKQESHLKDILKKQQKRFRYSESEYICNRRGNSLLRIALLQTGTTTETRQNKTSGVEAHSPRLTRSPLCRFLVCVSAGACSMPPRRPTRRATSSGWAPTAGGPRSPRCWTRRRWLRGLSPSCPRDTPSEVCDLLPSSCSFCVTPPSLPRPETPRVG